MRKILSIIALANCATTARAADPSFMNGTFRDPIAKMTLTIRQESKNLIHTRFSFPNASERQWETRIYNGKQYATPAGFVVHSRSLSGRSYTTVRVNDCPVEETLRAISANKIELKYRSCLAKATFLLNRIK